ncbi:uncharacterized protein LOC111317664 [Durio zibethinus]|uniref:Uncharacterized protein LOC111317664 n=1 Tax=Durio zibethinus TaxID=66656 RepID=A0A6P6BFD1_DURZI|nr:uncharacterized protein LOC111317664 [Durio zibethinus]
MDASDDDDDELFDFYDEFDGGDEDDVEEMFLPVGNMNKWHENKPRWFSEGKVYDTSIEVAEAVPSGIRVRVVNLPKKKNIHRDLKAAFDGFSGIANISSAVSGDKKTKDPVCRGFAFVHFKREDDEFGRVELGDGRDNLNVISESEQSSGNDMEPKFKHVADSISSNRLERTRALEKKLLAREEQLRVPKEQKGQKLERIRFIERKVRAKGNQQKVPKEQKVQKLDIPGSAKS